MHTNKTDPSPLFRRDNYLVMAFAGVLIIAGLALMTGDASTEHAFCPDIFSTRRIVVAPVLCFTGYLLFVVGIVWKGTFSLSQMSRVIHRLCHGEKR